MSIISKLATSLNRRDEVPNQKLAQEIISTKNTNTVQELIENLSANKNNSIRSDCIKVLYEIGATMPELIADYAKNFVLILDDKNNRLVWGAMTAIDTLTLLKADIVYKALGKLHQVADEGSVITRDHYVGILIKLASLKKYSEKVFPLLIEQLQTCPTNQLPMYAEHAICIITDNNKKEFVKTLSNRLDDIEKESKRKRVEKVIKKVSA